MAKARISEDDGIAAVMAWAREADAPNGSAAVGSAAGGRGGGTASGVPRGIRATAVRYTLQSLADRAPGSSVEVRVPPFGAVQCVEGPGHTRGTPPNVIETDAETWLALATGRLAWADALADARIRASGTRADVSAWLPVVRR